MADTRAKRRPVVLQRKDVLALIRKHRKRWDLDLTIDYPTWNGGDLALDELRAALLRMR